MRCPHCRLVIGAGRARAESDGEHGARAHGSAAGVVANAARRDDGEVLDRDVVLDALQEVAGDVGCPLDRLRMLDYQEAARDSTLPRLADVIATFGGWKQARREAVTNAPAAG
jgi:hypothetical protein